MIETHGSLREATGEELNSSKGGCSTMAQSTVEKEKYRVSRRSFLKGAGAVAGAAVIGLPSLQKVLAQALPPSLGALPKDTLLKMYTGMQRIRQLDQQIGVIQTADNKLPVGTLEGNAFQGGRKLQPGSGFPWEHTSIGEEAVNVGVATAMHSPHMKSLIGLTVTRRSWTTG